MTNAQDQKPSTEVAVFGEGCFWCTETDFENVPGVIKVTSGYTGGSDMQPVDGLGSDDDSGGETDSAFGMAEIIVDGLGDADQIDPALSGKAAQYGKAAIAADTDECVETELAIALDDFPGAVAETAIGGGIGERIAAIGRAQDGSALMQDALDGIRCELGGRDRTLEQAVRRLVDPDHRPAKAMRAQHRATDHRIETGTVAAAGHDAYSLVGRLVLSHGVPSSGRAGCQSVPTWMSSCRRCARW